MFEALNTKNYLIAGDYNPTVEIKTVSLCSNYE